MSSIYANFNDRNPAEIISNELDGKSYSKVYIKKVPQNISRYFTRLDQKCDKLTITFRGHISCNNDINIHISNLVICNADKWFDVPLVLLNSADYITVLNLNKPPLPERFSSKIKLNMYSNNNKQDIKPNSKYIAKTVEDLENVNLEYISKLILAADHDILCDMIKFAMCLVLKELHISYRYTCDRSDAPFFDLSILAGIKTRKLSLNTSKYTGMWKLVSTSDIPYISWVTSPNPSTHRTISGIITEELGFDNPDFDIDNNYTLMKFSAIQPYRDYYSKISELCIRNIKADYEKRFAHVKPCACAETAAHPVLDEE